MNAGGELSIYLSLVIAWPCKYELVYSAGGGRRENREKPSRGRGFVMAVAQRAALADVLVPIQTAQANGEGEGGDSDFYFRSRKNENREAKSVLGFASETS